MCICNNNHTVQLYEIKCNNYLIEKIVWNKVSKLLHNVNNLHDV